MKKRKRTKAKTYADKQHAKNRALQRFGLDFTKKVRNYFMTNRVFVEKQTNTRSLFKVLYEDSWYYFIYSNISKTIVTILPQDFELKREEAIKEYRRTKNRNREKPTFSSIPTKKLTVWDKIKQFIRKLLK